MSEFNFHNRHTLHKHALFLERIGHVSGFRTASRELSQSPVFARWLCPGSDATTVREEQILPILAAAAARVWECFAGGVRTLTADEFFRLAKVPTIAGDALCRAGLGRWEDPGQFVYDFSALAHLMPREEADKITEKYVRERRKELKKLGVVKRKPYTRKKAFNPVMNIKRNQNRAGGPQPGGSDGKGEGKETAE